MQPAGRWVLVDTRVDDSNDVLLVLDEALGVRHSGPGHLLAALPDDVVLLQDNTGTVAPTRPVLVSTFLLTDRCGRTAFTRCPRGRAPARGSSTACGSAPTRRGARRKCIEAGHHCNAEQFDGAIVSDVRVGPRGSDVAWVERLGPAEGASTAPSTSTFTSS